jgi:hypothetical protein
MRELKEVAIDIARIILGMVVLIEGLTVLIFIDYTSTMGGIYNKKVAAAYEDSYDNGYAQAYDVGYQEAYGEAYDKGYDRGYEIGLAIGSKEGVATRVELANPTYKEMKEFLAGDETDSNPYVVGEYVSFDFAVELNNNAEANGIRVAYVAIFAKEWGHGMVAFETIDKGLIFIEPQSDKEVRLVIGEPYPGYSVGAISPLGYFDPIVEIQIIW